MDILQTLIQQLEQKIWRNFKIGIVDKICYLILTLFQIPCVHAAPRSDATSKFAINFSKEIKKDYGFEVYGSGASIPVNIEWIGLSFSAGYPASIDEGRKLIVPITRKFIQRMNEDADVLKYLAQPPASLNNVDLTIRFDDTLESPLQSIMVIGSKNLIVYNRFDESRKKLINLHKETFDEAVRLVQQGTGSSFETPK